MPITAKIATAAMNLRRVFTAFLLQSRGRPPVIPHRAASRCVS
jgi:hypothetical protein